MSDYDDEMNDDDDYLDEDELMDGLEPRTTESGDLLDDSNPFGYDDLDDYGSDEEEDED